MGQDEYTQTYNNMINTYLKYGRIGRTKPYNIEHARRVAHMITIKIMDKKQNNKIKNTINLPIRRGTEPSSDWKIYRQLNLFQG